jgi:hypothetical protein
MIESILFYAAMTVLGFVVIFLSVAILREIALAIMGKSDLFGQNCD